MAKVAAIVGVGPGLGRSLALRFAREGYAVAVLSRNESSWGPILADLETDQRLGLSVDVTDHAAVTEAFRDIQSTLGPTSTLVYNAATRPIPTTNILDIAPDRFSGAFEINCTGALVAAQQVLPGMLENKQGCIIFTGATASLKGSAGFAPFATGKFALRALGQSMAREFGPQGIHVAHVIIDGMISRPHQKEKLPSFSTEKMMSPDAIADQYFNIAQQDQSAWCFEMDLVVITYFAMTTERFISQFRFKHESGDFPPLSRYLGVVLR